MKYCKFATTEYEGIFGSLKLRSRPSKSLCRIKVKHWQNLQHSAHVSVNLHVSLMVIKRWAALTSLGDFSTVWNEQQCSLCCWWPWEWNNPNTTLVEEERGGTRSLFLFTFTAAHHFRLCEFVYVFDWTSTLKEKKIISSLSINSHIIVNRSWQPPHIHFIRRV